jgi:RND family efflux transporter MFP subunit|uniref:Efflux RND transporter periplasmic adaptor subunit n=1 Tax=Desulfomonile tiedjei TaxID=2358 RepID=A0A7C4EWL5_9BACT
MTSKLSHTLLTILLIAAATLSACNEGSKQVQPQPPEVIVSHPLEREVTQYLDFSGSTAAIEFVEIRARVEGWLESMHFVPGSYVKAGDLLFVIDQRPFQAQVDLMEASLKGREAELALKRANLKRAEQLLATASISQLQYDIQNADESVAAAQVGIAQADLEKAKLDLAYTRVTSPINGRVSRNYVDIGNLVGAREKTLLTEVVNDSSVYVYFDVSERDLLMLMRKYPRVQDEASTGKEKAPVYLQLADEKGFEHQGTIDFVESRIDVNTGTLRVRGLFANDKGLLVPGLFGRVRVPIDRKTALLVPELAVGISQAGRYVFVVNRDQVVEQRLVKTGPLEGSLRAIEEGLSKDEWVVVNAIQRARPGIKVTPKESSISEALGEFNQTSSPKGSE